MSMWAMPSLLWDFDRPATHSTTLRTVVRSLRGGSPRSSRLLELIPTESARIENESFRDPPN
eukprot:scaffold137_cov398-Prasinococcus_capsulatus_cf.AAC.33